MTEYEMIDLHCHILPDLDDGPDSWDQAIQMAKMAVSDGINTIVATPHIHVPSNADIHALVALEKKIEKSVVKLRHHCTELGLPLRLVAGGEVDAGLSHDSIRSFALNTGNYILIEFPHFYLPDNAAETIFNLRVAGLTPIIAHPERNQSVIERPERLIQLTHSGALVQITGGSLLGEFGRHAKACAEYLLKIGNVSFLASDAHSPYERFPALSSAVRAAKRIIGTEAARDLVVTNPGAVLSGSPLPRMAPRESVCLQSPF